MKATFKEWASKCQAFINEKSFKVQALVCGASTSMILMQIPASAEEDATISTGLSVWSTVLATVWDLIKANPLLAAIATGSLLSIGIGLFGKVKHRC